MGRNRVIYQSEGVYVSDYIDSTLKENHHELIRVQGANYGFSMNKTDVNQYGKAARIDKINLDLPTVNFDMSYYLGDGYNESALGFDITASYQFAKTHIEQSSGKNFYIITSNEGIDANTLALGDPYSLIGIGNAFVTDYSVDLSVGSLPTVNLSCECSNINSVNGNISGEGYWALGVSGDTAAMNLDRGIPYEQSINLIAPSDDGTDGPTALKPGDITITFEGFDGNPNGAESISKTSGNKSFHVQSANLSVPLSRSELKRIGSKGAYARVVDYPIRARLDVNAILTNVETVDLARSISGCQEPGLNNRVTISANSCDGEGAINWTLIKPLLISERFSSNIGPNKSVDLSFEVEVGDPEDLSIGIICSGASQHRVLPREEDDPNFPTRVYGYYYDGPTYPAEGVFEGPDNILLNYYSGESIPNSWEQNYLNAQQWGDKDNRRRLALGGATKYIGNYAFQDSHITGQVYFPPSITGMGIYAFNKCRDINEVILNVGISGVPQACFTGCSSLNKVQATDNLEYLDYDSFAQCTSLSDFYWSKNLKYIGFRSFRGCASLRTVQFYDGLEQIRQEAFFSAGITGVNIPNSVTNLEDYVFKNCSLLTEAIIGSGISELDTSTFQSCTSLTSLDIPNTIDTIGVFCFSNCNGLPYVNIPDSVQVISGSAFNSCTSLQNVGGCNNLVGIGPSAFYGCDSLLDFNLSNTLTYIGDSAFFSCDSLGGILDIPPNVTYVGDFAYSQTAIEQVNINSIMTEITDSCFSTTTSMSGTLFIPSNIQQIGTSSFASCGVSGVDFSEGLLSIGDSAFRDTNLSGVEFPQSLTTLGAGSFYECSSLEYIDFSTNPLFNTVPSTCFQSCISLTGVILPDNVDFVDTSAFRNCVALTGVDFGNSVTGLGSYAFNNCISLDNLSFPNTLTRIYNNCFNACTSLSDIVLPSSLEYIDYRAFVSCAISGELVIPDNTTFIDYNAFENCTSLSGVDLGVGITSLEHGTFTGCTSLETINLGSITSIDYRCFERCLSLNNIDLSSCSFIGSNAFNRCQSLSGVQLPATLTDVAAYAFTGCTSLTGVEFSEGTETISNNAFQSCGLTEINLPNSLTGIGNAAFGGCTSLTNIDLNQVKGIGGSAFVSCGLTSVSIPNSVTGLGTNAFQNCISLVSANIPQNATYVEIEERTFQGCTSLTEITIPSTIDIVGNNAFTSCTSLSGIYIENGVEVLGTQTTTPPGTPSNYYGPFRSCSSLGSFTLEIPNSIILIGYQTFQGTNLSGIRFTTTSPPYIEASAIPVSTKIFAPLGSEANYAGQQTNQIDWDLYDITFE